MSVSDGMVDVIDQIVDATSDDTGEEIAGTEEAGAEDAGTEHLGAPIASDGGAEEAAVDDGPPTNPAKKVAKEVGAQDDAEAKDESSTKAWAEVQKEKRELMAESARIKEEAERVRRQKDELEKKQAAIAQFEENPYKWASENKRDDVIERFANGITNPEKFNSETRIERLERENASIRQMLEERDRHEKIQRYISDATGALSGAADGEVVREWWSPDELPGVIENTAGKHVTKYGKLLTKDEVADTILKDLKERLERVAKTEVGQRFLQAYIAKKNGEETPAPPSDKKTISPQIKNTKKSAPKKILNAEDVMEQIIEDVAAGR